MLVSPKVVDEELLAERHGHLVAAATELFIDKGFHKTSVREIAAAAGWQMGTLYLYIARKEDVLFLVMQRIMAELATVVSEVRPRSSERDTFTAAVEFYFRICARIHRELRLAYREWPSLLPQHEEAARQQEEPVWEFFAGIVRRGILAGEFRPVNPDLVAQNVIMLAHLWALKDKLRSKMSFDDYRRQQMDVLLASLIDEPAATEGIRLAEPA